MDAARPIGSPATGGRPGGRPPGAARTLPLRSTTQRLTPWTPATLSARGWTASSRTLSTRMAAGRPGAPPWEAGARTQVATVTIRGRPDWADSNASET